MAQAVSGATFGGISFFYYGQFPDIHGIAVVALTMKVVCAALGFALAAQQLFFHPSAVSIRYGWVASFGLGAWALSAAAILRWFS